MISLKAKTPTLQVNPHVEVRALVADGWIKNETGSLEEKAEDLVKQVEALTDIGDCGETVLDDFSAKVIEYRNLFPNIRLPSKKAAWADKKNLETAFKFFFKTYDYDWDTVLEATSRYVYEFSQSGYRFMQTSQYFIRKMNSDRTWSSELANCCAAVVTGQNDFEDKHFSDTVV